MQAHINYMLRSFVKNIEKRQQSCVPATAPSINTGNELYRQRKHNQPVIQVMQVLRTVN